MPVSTSDSPFRVIDLKLQYVIRRAAPARVWQIMTTRTNQWWKQANFHIRPGSTFHVDLRAGGQMWEQYADGGGSLLWWTINEIVPEKALGFTGILTMASMGPLSAQMRIELAADD